MKKMTNAADGRRLVLLAVTLVLASMWSSTALADDDDDDDRRYSRTPTIVEFVATTPGLESLAAAATKLELLEFLQRQRVTVFAPTNEAFVALLDSIGFPPNDQGFYTPELLPPADVLGPIVLNHVLDRPQRSSRLLRSGGAETLGDTPVGISVSNAGVGVNNANIVVRDIVLRNGIVQVIDAVLF